MRLANFYDKFFRKKLAIVVDFIFIINFSFVLFKTKSNIRRNLVQPPNA